jgi:hypothetical protein
MNICSVLLPDPSADLIQALTDCGKTKDIDETVYQLVQSSNPDINCAACIYFTSPEIITLGREEYQSFFGNEEFVVLGLIFRNTKPMRPAFYPPHTDMQRLCSFNYILNEGGKKVTTTYYRSAGSYDDLDGNMTTFHSETPIAEYHLSEKTWYGLDVIQTHSVNNIEHDRFVLAISFPKMTLDELVRKYPHTIYQTV